MHAWSLGVSIPDPEAAITQVPSYPGVPVVQLAIRFILELILFTGAGLLGWQILRLPGAILLAIGSMALWGVFGVPKDGVRGEPTVIVPGRVRFLLELALFGLGAWGIWVGWNRAAAETYLTVVMLTNVLMWERCRWLLTNRSIN
jgi:Protein of unknown function (DUF2568)